VTNPYTPPKSMSPESIAPEQQTRRPGRPKSVWLFLCIWTPITVFYAIVLMRNMAIAIDYAMGEGDLATLAFYAGWRSALLVLLVALMVLVWRRRQAGRWGGLLAIGAVMAFAFLAPDRATYASAAERAGAVFARHAFIPALLAWWAYQFGFSRAARAYFSAKPVAAPFDQST